MPSSSPPSVPRLYQDCTLLSGGKAPISFEALFSICEVHGTITNSPLFSGTLANDVNVFIKMARCYGQNVHTFLAGKGHAPVLYGISSLEGAPNCYVMERLSEEWVPLHKIFLKDDFLANRKAIKHELIRILDCLRKNNYVHGDFRPNNLLIDMNRLRKRQVSIKVVDFDWSGEVGIARYPTTRNPNGDWPGKPGRLIEQGDDGVVLEKWWVF